MHGLHHILITFKRTQNILYDKNHLYSYVFNLFLAEKRNYITMLCMGYIKPWVMTKTASSGDVDDDNEDSEGINLNSLIAVGLPLGKEVWVELDLKNGSKLPPLS